MHRRGFLRTTLGAAALSLAPSLPARAVGDPRTSRALTITRRTLEVNGRAAPVFGLVGPDGRPGLRFRAGEMFDVVLRNDTTEDTIVHWHGLAPPWAQDGVADAPLPLLEAHGERRFNFPIGNAGTHWMHAHTLQKQALLAAPLIVEDAETADEQEVVIMLEDFTFTPAEELLARLRRGGHGDIANMGSAMAGMDHGPMAMPMVGMDHGAMVHANDIDHDAYLANDRTLDDPEVVPVGAGGRVRLRIINAAAATAFTIDLGRLSGAVIAVDGKDVTSLPGGRFPLAMGQRIDLRVQLPGAGAFPILALRESAQERTGIILKTPGAAVSRISSIAERSGPQVSAAMEVRLRSVTPLAEREPDRAYQVMLMGGMGGGYEWGMHSQRPLLVREGQRTEITFSNHSMMSHPMHLHGHHFQVVAFDGWRFEGAVRDTVLVPPMRSVTIAVDANNPGAWALHCHHLYHMAAGMMGTFGYEA